MEDAKGLRDVAQAAMEDQSTEWVAVVEGRKIYASEMDLKIEMYTSAGEDAQQAWQGMKLIALEEAFAKDHGLMPSEDEILEFAKEMRKEYEADPEQKAYISIFAEGLGMSLDTYWYEYRTKYEIPVLMVRKAVTAYLKENQMEDLRAEDAKVEIVDEDYFAEKGIKVAEGELSPLLYACKSYIDESDFSAARKSQIDYSQYHVTRDVTASYGEYDFVITSEAFSEAEISNYSIVLVGDIQDEMHAYAVLLVDEKNVRVLGYEPVKYAAGKCGAKNTKKDSTGCILFSIISMAWFPTPWFLLPFLFR